MSFAGMAAAAYLLLFLVAEIRRWRRRKRGA